MKMFKLTQMASVAAAVAGLAFGIAPATAAPTIGFTAPTPGGTVDVVVSDLAGDIVAAYDLDVAFNSIALTFTSLTFGASLGDELLSEVINSGPFDLGGLIDFAAVSLLTDAELGVLQGGGPVTLATLTFAGADFSSLAFVNWGPFNDVKGAGNRVIIGQVPEPATFGLVGMALLAAGFARRRAA
jgi:hypothetical protein